MPALYREFKRLDDDRMQNLANLMRSPRGQEWLASKGVFTSQQKFIESLKLPAQSDLAVTLGVNGRKLICAGQQLYTDYHQSVLSKILTLREFKDNPDLFPFFLWVDTDRSGLDILL